jgi:drug/metabolite transporter (DMT)-like permease
MQIILMIIIARYNKESLVGPREHRKLLLIRGVLGSISFISFGFSIKYIQATDAQALYNVRLVIIPILAFIFLKEKLKIIHIIGFILTIIGVVFICEQSQLMSLIMTSNQKNCTNQTSQPAFKTGLGFALGLVSAVAASCVAIFLKKLTNLKVHFSVNVIFTSYIGFPSALLISLIMYLTGSRDADTKTDNLPLQLFFSLSSAICGCLNQLLVAIANKYENANKLAIASTTNLLWSFLFDATFFVNQQCSFLFINVFNVSGALLILLAAVFNIILKIVEEKRKKMSPAG